MIVADGEGATKVAAISVRNAASAEDAECAARAVANSLLVKTAWAGLNPAAGRIVDALGYSGAALETGSIDIRYDGLEAIAGGVRGSATEQELSRCVAQKLFRIDIDLQQGDNAATVYTCNITEEYVRINM
jgi:glutamate N-acetyltransferase/amino-acid N-acetyltransferase